MGFSRTGAALGHGSGGRSGRRPRTWWRRERVVQALLSDASARTCARARNRQPWQRWCSRPPPDLHLADHHWCPRSPAPPLVATILAVVTTAIAAKRRKSGDRRMASSLAPSSSAPQWAESYNPWTGLVKVWPLQQWCVPSIGVLGPHPGSAPPHDDGVHRTTGHQHRDLLQLHGDPSTYIVQCVARHVDSRS